MLKSAHPFFEYCSAFQAEDEAVEIRPGIVVEAERSRYELRLEARAKEVEAWKNLFHCVVEAVSGII